MAVNKVDAVGGRITLQGDYVIHHQDDVTFALEGDRLPQTLVGNYKGDIFVTNSRLIFVNEDSTKGYKSFSMDFQHIRNTEVKQPIFGSNYIKGYVTAQPNGGWEGSANFKIDFPKGGAIDFAEHFQKAVKDSLQYRQNGMAPQPPPPQNQNGFYPAMGAPPPGGYYYPPPQSGFYAYQPALQPSPGGQQSLYTAPTGQAPPAYSANGNFYPNIPSAQAQEQTSANAKAQEAYMSGNNVYVPNEPPPPYNPSYNSDGRKKDQ